MGASPHRPHRSADRQHPIPWPAAAAARAVVAGLTVWMAVIHLHLWSIGYRHVHIIGVLFLLNGIIGIALAVALLVTPRRLLAAIGAATTLFIAGTLVGLILSMTTGLFGFHEFAGAPFLNESIIVEAVGIVLGAMLTAIYARETQSWLKDFLHRASPLALTGHHLRH